MRVPLATYRLQLTAGLGFRRALEIVPYLERLGISDLYASPIFTARPGSLSGYDVTDPNRLHPELGSKDDFLALADGLRSRGMGLLLDIVPNHMAASHENAWWRDVLESGPASPYSRFFDVRWKPVGQPPSPKALLPVLGDLYGTVLERGELALAFEDGAFLVRYHERKLPLDPMTCLPILALARREMEEGGSAAPGLEELIEVSSAIESLPGGPPGRAAGGDPEGRRGPKQAIKERLRDIHARFPAARAGLEAALRALNSGRNTGRDGGGLLHQVLDRQAYRLSFWKTSMERLNYRRFFDVSDLVGVRVQDEKVFEATHELIRSLSTEGRATGLRIDHIDGLSDPLTYLLRVRDRIVGAPGAAAEAPSPSGCGYVVVEKILMPGEDLPAAWPVAGTTGYDFLNAVNRLFVDREGFLELERIYAELAGSSVPFAEIVREKKMQVIREIFPSETRHLVEELLLLAEVDRHARDLPYEDLERALIELTASLPVYRTYIAAEVTPGDRRIIEGAVEAAARYSTGWSADALSFLRSVLLLETQPGAPGDDRDARARFVRRWQQWSGPVMAKGLEDTALYGYAALISLNEVGGQPVGDGMSPEAFHGWARERQARWPHTMNATSTHDTKRSEDVRARIDVLSEIPGLWRKHLKRWMRWNRPKKAELEGKPVPGPVEEIFLYQTLLGAWPFRRDESAFSERVKAYMLKAAKEAKVHTRWTAPHEEYEKALASFVERVLDPSEEGRFLDDFVRFEAKVAFHGAFNSLGQVLIKIASPGVPDFYQGNELWDLSLVDPDNRRPVDFEARARLLGELAGAGRVDPRDLVETWPDGRIKLFVTTHALQARRERPALFLEGDYEPLPVRGSRARSVIAFARRHRESWVLALAPRLLAGMIPPGRLHVPAQAWEDTAVVLPAGAPARWTNAFLGDVVEPGPGGELSAAAAFGDFPVALLVSEGR